MPADHTSLPAGDCPLATHYESRDCRQWIHHVKKIHDVVVAAAAVCAAGQPEIAADGSPAAVDGSAPDRREAGSRPVARSRRSVVAAPNVDRAPRRRPPRRCRPRLAPGRARRQHGRRASRKEIGSHHRRQEGPSAVDRSLAAPSRPR